jgi:hypothetical protein
MVINCSGLANIVMDVNLMDIVNFLVRNKKFRDIVTTPNLNLTYGLN